MMIKSSFTCMSSYDKESNEPIENQTAPKTKDDIQIRNDLIILIFAFLMLLFNLFA